MTKAICKKCGTEWTNKDEIVRSTEDEHRKVTGHYPELN